MEQNKYKNHLVRNRWQCCGSCDPNVYRCALMHLNRGYSLRGTLVGVRGPELGKWGTFMILTGVALICLPFLDGHWPGVVAFCCLVW